MMKDIKEYSMKGIILKLLLNKFILIFKIKFKIILKNKFNKQQKNKFSLIHNFLSFNMMNKILQK